LRCYSAKAGAESAVQKSGIAREKHFAEIDIPTEVPTSAPNLGRDADQSGRFPLHPGDYFPDALKVRLIRVCSSVGLEIQIAKDFGLTLLSDGAIACVNRPGFAGGSNS
jgi:hypothetical protein